MTASLFSANDTKAIEEQIEAYFSQAIKRAKQTHPSYHYLWKSLDSFVKAGGKRFRPNMTILAYRLFGGTQTEAIIPIAAAQELLHLSLLIHDDIIDRDYMRYGVPNMSGRYKAYYQQHLNDDEELTHFAHSASILAGDLLLAGAYELIMKSPVSSDQKAIAHSLLSNAIFDVAGGELMDTEASFLPYTAGDAIKIALFKTARYSFVTPLLTGARLAGITQSQEHALCDYAEALGIAYQLVDDLLGVFGTENQTGKSTLGDIREGKRTFMIEQSLGAMTTNDKVLFNLAFGNQHATTESIYAVKDLLVSSGAKAKTEEMIKQYRERAMRAVSDFQLDSTKSTQFKTFVTTVTERVS